MQLRPKSIVSHEDATILLVICSVAASEFKFSNLTSLQAEMAVLELSALQDVVVPWIHCEPTRDLRQQKCASFHTNIMSSFQWNW